MRIATPEGVDVELTLAGIGSRFIAALFDLIMQGSGRCSRPGSRSASLGGDGGGLAVAIFSILVFLVFFGYDVLFEVRSRGRTPGKRWTGLRVVRTGGQPITFVPSCVRNVMRLVDFLPAFYAIGMLSIFVTRAQPAARRPRRRHAGRARAARRRARAPAPHALSLARAGAGRVGRQRGLRPRRRHRAPVPRPPRGARRGRSRGPRRRPRAAAAPARRRRAGAARARGVPRAARAAKADRA